MRKFLFAGVAATALAVLSVAPSQARASWLSEWLHQQFDPVYYGTTYYAPAYGYFTPYRSFYYAPGYYRGWYGYPRAWHEWREHEWREHHGQGWHEGHEHHHR